MKRLIAVAVVGIVVVALFSGTVRRMVGFSYQGGKDKVEVHLTMQGGICMAKGPVADIGGGWKYKIEWTVINECPTAQYAGFLEYQERLAGGGLGPIETGIVVSDPADSNQIPPGGSDKVKAKIDKLHLSWSNTDKVYKYKICAGPAAHPTTNCLDPDADVGPF